MINFLHTYQPDPILISFGFINIYWYGLFIILGALLAILVTLKLASLYKIKKEIIIDLTFWLIIGGLIGARLYYIFLESAYYLARPVDIFKIWQGGLAIHGAIFAGLIMAWLFAKKYKLNFFLLTSLLAPGLILAQAIGRWGNYFNQELFGLPTSLSWGIPIEPANRVLEYVNSQYFHPAFLYESLGNLLIFIGLILFHYYIIKNKKFINSVYCLLFAVYLVLYSVLRFFMEFIRIDKAPELLGLRWPQIISLAIILIILVLLPKYKKDVSLK